jgi:hypothetical protein
MTCKQLIRTLSDFNQPDALMFFDPPDGDGGLYELCSVQRVANDGKLACAALFSLPSMGPVRLLTSKELQSALRQMPDESEVVYDNSHQDRFVPVASVHLLQRHDLDARGFSETSAPAILLSGWA